MGIVPLILNLIGSWSEPCAPKDIQYIVDVEDGIVEPFFALEVSAILNDEDGWTQAWDGKFCQGTSPNFAVILATPEKTDEMCLPMRTMSRVSCSRNGRAVINLKRWREGAEGWELHDYRRYLINHEVGHVLGMGHRKCPEDSNELTPVMKQQSSSKIKCSRGNEPTESELESMSKKKWGFFHLRKKLIKDPWEKPT
jgi:hypothetical protein